MRQYELAKGDRLSSLQLISSLLNKGGQHVIVAPPNSGKSYAAINELKAAGVPFLFVADTIALAEDLGSSYSIPVHYKGNFQPTNTPQLITIPFYAHNFVRQGRVLVVDEWHSLVTDHNYRSQPIELLADTFGIDGNWEMAIALTGTPTLQHDQTIVDWEQHLVITKEPPIILDFIPVSNHNNAISRLLENVDSSLPERHWISLLSTKNSLSRVNNALIKAGYRSNEILNFNSDTRNNNRSIDLLRSNKYPTKTKIIISTFRQGFSVNEDGIVLHILSNVALPHSPIDIAQVCFRFRNRDSKAPAYLYASIPNGLFKPLDLQKADEYWLTEFNARRERYRKDFSFSGKPTITQMKLINIIENAPEKFRVDQGLSALGNLFRKDFSQNDISRLHYHYAQVSEWANASTENMRHELKRFHVELNVLENYELKKRILQTLSELNIPKGQSSAEFTATWKISKFVDIPSTLIILKNFGSKRQTLTAISAAIEYQLSDEPLWKQRRKLVASNLKLGKYSDEELTKVLGLLEQEDSYFKGWSANPRRGAHLMKVVHYSRNRYSKANVIKSINPLHNWELPPIGDLNFEEESDAR